FTSGGEQRLAYFGDIAAVGDADRYAKPHPRIAISPVGYRRVDKFRVWHNHRDVVVRANDRAASANLLHLTRNTRDFDAVTDGDWSFGQNYQTTDKITGDILQAKADAHANRARENRQRAQVNAGILQDNQNANYQHDIANDLGNGVLEGTIQSAIDEKPIEKKAFRSRGDPKNRD